jgi:hypothetical protein
MAGYEKLEVQSRDEIQTYDCKFINGPKPELTGRLDTRPWQDVEYTADFIDIRGTSEPHPKYRTRVKMLWDYDYLYFGAEMEEPHVWTSITEKNSVIYWQNDFEIFIDPDNDGLNYYEFEMNALNTIWELTLDKPYNKGGKAVHPTNIDGLISSVHIDGTINDPTDVDRGWSVEVAIPWKGLAKYNSGKATPPNKGDSWRINFSRVQWDFKIVNGTYERVPAENSWDIHYESNWVWSNQGEINMHIPERWGYVRFVD